MPQELGSARSVPQPQRESRSHAPGTRSAVARDDDAVASSFEASRDAPARVRRWLAQRLPAGSREAATLAASEVVTNALMHGHLTADEQIEVAVIAADGRVRVSVAHRGDAFVPTWARTPGAHGGWGLRVVESVTHAWGVKRDGSRAIVWFEV